MKNRILIALCVFLLAACERPATVSNWSPINDAGTPPPESLSTETLAQKTAIDATQSTKETELAPLPTLDLAQFPDPLPASLKGYELMSWQVGEDWNFTLVTGTNREKTFEELMQPDSEVTDSGFVKITVSGVDQIKRVLAMLPADSQVFWGGMDLSGQVPEGTVYFSYPPQATMDEIADFCAENQINLVNLAEPQ